MTQVGDIAGGLTGGLTGGLDTATVEDDEGVEHVLTFITVNAFHILGTVLPKLEELAIKDMLDQLLDAALYGVAPKEGPDPVLMAIEYTADKIITSGDQELVTSLLAHVTRDGQRVTGEAAFNATYAGNWGELQRTLVIVLQREFGNFFERRVSHWRKGVGRILDAVTSRLSEQSLTQLIASAIRGFSGPSGITPMEESASES